MQSIKTIIVSDERIIERVKNIIESKCNLRYNQTEKCYRGEIYAYYMDELDNRTIKDIFDSSNPTEHLFNSINDCYIDSETDCYDEIFDEIRNHFDDDSIYLYFEDYEEYIRDWVHENVYFAYPYDHYLKQSVEIDIIVDMGDENYDYTLNCVYPHYNGICGDTISDEAAIVWLAKQQGYTKTQLNNALRNCEFGGSKFLESLYEEILNCTTHMNALTFFVKMTIEECLDLNERIKADTANDDKNGYRGVEKRHGTDYVILTKGTSCGLYDPWSGAGSAMEVKLEKDIKLPLKHISTALPDGCRGYGIGSIYGMCSSFWKSNCMKKCGDIL